MKRPNRVEMYQAICRKAGMQPTSSMGYFSRSEMLELNSFIDKTMGIIDTIAKLKNHPALSTTQGVSTCHNSPE